MLIPVQKNKRIKTVVNKLDSIDTQFRFFKMELIAGEPNYVVEHVSSFSSTPNFFQTDISVAWIGLPIYIWFHWSVLEFKTPYRARSISADVQTARRHSGRVCRRWAFCRPCCQKGLRGICQWPQSQQREVSFHQRWKQQGEHDLICSLASRPSHGLLGEGSCPCIMWRWLGFHSLCSAPIALRPFPSILWAKNKSDQRACTASKLCEYSANKGQYSAKTDFTFRDELALLCDNILGCFPRHSIHTWSWSDTRGVWCYANGPLPLLHAGVGAR